MRKICLLLACAIFLMATPLYGDKIPHSYLESVLTQYFDIDLPAPLLKEKKIPSFIAFLKTKGFHYYERGQDASREINYYGKLQFSKDDLEMLWLYRQRSVHSGTFLILNKNLEVIYFKADMGSLYELEIKDLLQDGKNILMITHGAGGTGTYTKLTDLITIKNGVPELKFSLLREFRDCNITTGTDIKPCIRCYTRQNDFNNLKHVTLENGRKAIVIETLAEATLDSQSITSEERNHVNQVLEKEYGLKLDGPAKVTATIQVESIDVPIIYHGKAEAPICPAYVYYGYAWPTLSKIAQ